MKIFSSLLARMNFNDIPVILSHLNPFSTIVNGFLDIWLEKYYRTSDKTLNKKYYRFILLFMIMFLIRVIKLLTIDLYSDRLSIYLGSFAPLMGGPPKYWGFLFLMWTINFIGFYYFTFNCKRDQYSWLELFRFLDNSMDNRIVGFGNNDLTSELRRRAKIAFFISNHCISVITLFGLFALFLIFYKNYAFEDFLTYGIIWSFIWTVWVYYACVVIYWLPSYFYIICYYFKTQFRILENHIKLIKRSQNNILVLRKEALIMRFIKNHNEICRKLTNFNNFWQKYLSQTFMIFLTIILFLSYLYFFTNMPPIPKFEFTIILSFHVLVIVILLYSSSSVSHVSITTYKLLQSIAVENFTVRSKLKVSKALNFNFVLHHL
jgi:ABC-type multidrug transport system fused ATPase/permease subunit